ncbi:MAG: prepilin-type N-terminal cleavage/methylation domain-containing protein [Lentisphaerales bacterium]|nr:prepilin-type N-terminal cleavage/methylation domain-containing protein [Lentisphaerales bacterium]
MIKYKSKRFTLIEVLMVIAIISILASILLPLLSKARYKARIALCASAQKQNAIALIMYTDDHDGRLPKITNFNQPQFYRYFYDPDNDEYKALGELYKNQYLLSGKTLFCPEANIGKAGTKQSYDWYLVNGEWDPKKALQGSTKAGRSNYIIYPYEVDDSQWNLGEFSSDEMLHSDLIWSNIHKYNGVNGWNVMKVDTSLKFTQNIRAQAYRDNNSDIFGNWEKAALIRDMLLE